MIENLKPNQHLGVHPQLLEDINTDTAIRQTYDEFIHHKYNKFPMLYFEDAGSPPPEYNQEEISAYLDTHSALWLQFINTVAFHYEIGNPETVKQQLGEAHSWWLISCESIANVIKTTHPEESQRIQRMIGRHLDITQELDQLPLTVHHSTPVYFPLPLEKAPVNTQITK